jgi:hypothetical protein
MDDEYLLCRGLRHAWSPQGKFHAMTAEEQQGVKKLAGYAQIVRLNLECARCGAQRIDLYGRSRRGQVNGELFIKLRYSYVYPENYQFRGSEIVGDRPKSTDYYKELYRRLS